MLNKILWGPYDLFEKWMDKIYPKIIAFKHKTVKTLESKIEFTNEKLFYRKLFMYMTLTSYWTILVMIGWFFLSIIFFHIAKSLNINMIGVNTYKDFLHYSKEGFENTLGVVILGFAGVRMFTGAVFIIGRLNAKVATKYFDFLSDTLIEIFVVVVAFALDYTICNSLMEKAFVFTNGSVTPTNLFEAFADFLYFSVVTLATVGFGDISPAIITTRILVVFEIISGFILVVVVLTNFANIKHAVNKEE